MTILRTIAEQDATGLVGEIYAEDIDDIGYVPSHTKVMALHPEAYRAWEQLITAIGRPMDKRRYELVTLAAADALESKHCRLAHGKKTLRYIDEQALTPIARDHRDAGLTEAEVAMMDFAAKVSTDSASMTDADTTRLRDLGFSDRDIVDITLAAAARNYFSRALQALGVEVDVPAGLSDSLTDALVGRYV